MTFGASSLPLYVTLSCGICRSSVGRLLEDSLWTSGYSPDISYREPISQRLSAILSSQSIIWSWGCQLLQ